MHSARCGQASAMSETGVYWLPLAPIRPWLSQTDCIRLRSQRPSHREGHGSPHFKRVHAPPKWHCWLIQGPKGDFPFLFDSTHTIARKEISTDCHVASRMA